MCHSCSPDTADWDSLSEEDKKRRAREMEVYAAMVDNMDFHIGRLLSYLENSGMRENTLIVFMSDNGLQGANTGRVPIFSQEWIDSTFDNSFDNMGKKNSYIYYGPHWAEASVAPSELFKGFTTEGGIKVPSIINFKGKLGNLEGQFQDEFMTILDLAPTFLELAETKPLGTQYKGRDVYPHVGKSIVPFLRWKI